MPAPLLCYNPPVMQKKNSPFWVFMAFCLLSWLMTWPVLGRFGTHIPGSEGDVWVHLWTFHWVRDALLAGQSVYQTPALFYPQGTELYSHNIAWLHIALWLPLQLIFHEATAYTLIFISTFAFNGWATYWFAHTLWQKEKPAIVAGLIVAFWPYTLSHHNHPNLIFIAWVPLAMWAVHQLFHHNRWRDALWLALFLALLGITRWQHLVIGGVMITLYAGWLLLEREWRVSKPILPKLLVSGVISLLLMAPLLAPVIQYQTSRHNPQDLLTEAEGAQADLLGYMLPSRYHPLWGEAIFNIAYDNLGTSQVLTPFIGYTVLFLAIWGASKRWYVAKYWVGLTGVYLLLALGPTLIVNGQAILSLPYQLIEGNLLFALVRHPDRFNVLLGLPIAILAGYGIQQVRQTWVVWLLAGLILLEYSTYYETLPLYVPAWHTELAEQPEPFAILDLPMHNRVYDEYYMYYQLMHGKPLVGGHVSRPPRENFTFIETIPLLQNNTQQRTPPSELDDIGTSLHRLAQGNVPYLVLHKPFLTVDELAKWQTWLPMPPAYEDGDVVVYETAVSPSQLPTWQPLHKGIGILQTELSPAETAQGSWLTVNLLWGSDSPPSQDQEICFALSNSSQSKQTTCFTLPTNQWEPNALTRAEYTFALDNFLPTDTYTVLLTLDDKQIHIGQTTFTAQPRTFAPANTTTQTQFGRLFGLTHYELQVEGDTVQVHLDWLALERTAVSYKLFLHLRNPQGEIVQQLDTVPRNWGYPTNWWETGEQISDTLTLPNVPTGTYTLWLGVYHPETNDRLTNPDGLENAFLLGELTR